MMVGLENAEGGADMESYSFCQRDGNRYDLLANLPAAGSYILKAYAKNRNDTGEYNSVLKFRIDAVLGDENGSGFPTAYGKFAGAGAYLYSPLEGRLKEGESYHFQIRVPGAEDVAVVCGEEWTHLAKRGDLFEGNATAAKGDVEVYAKFRGGKWDGMVKYRAE
jgi:hypothetical protein